MRGAAPNQQLQAGITVIMWEEMQLRELHLKTLSFKSCSQVPPCHAGGVAVKPRPGNGIFCLGERSQEESSVIISSEM